MLRLCTIAGTVLLLVLPLAAQQQDNATPPPQQNQSAPAGNGKKDDQSKAQQQKKPTGESNPFPEAASEAAAHKAQQQNDTPSAPQPNDPPGASPSKKHPSTADENPFPEAASEAAAHKAEQQESDSPPAPSGKGNSDQDYSSSHVTLKGLDPSTESRPAEPTLNPDLGRKDTKVGVFYLQSGDYKGAYDRFLEATQVDPGNAEAVFGLAEAARHLNRPDEAAQNYRLYLSALPDGPKAKDARKALKAMGAPAP